MAGLIWLWNQGAGGATVSHLFVKHQTAAESLNNSFYIPFASGSVTSTTFYGGRAGVAMTVKNLYVDLSAAPGGASDSWTITLYVNGSPSALTTTISVSATSGSDTSNSVSVAAGDIIYWRVVEAGTCNATKIRLSCEADCSTVPMIGGSGNTGVAASSVYSALNDNTGKTSQDVGTLFPMNGTLDQFYLYTEQLSTLEAVTYTLQRWNGSTWDDVLALTHDWTTYSANTREDLSSSVSVSQGQVYRWKYDRTAGSDTHYCHVGCRFTPSPSGATFVSGCAPIGATSNNRYAAAFGYSTDASTAGLTGLAAFNATATQIHTRASAGPGTGDEWTVYLQKGGTNTALGAQVTGTNTSASDTDSVAYTGGTDTLGIFIDMDTSATDPDDPTWMAWAVIFGTYSAATRVFAPVRGYSSFLFEPVGVVT